MATADSFGLFWNSDAGDRKYNADSMERWLKKFFRTGVFEGDLQVVEASGMTIHVNTGYCNVNGKVGLFEAVNAITLDAPNSIYPRIDTIVIERNDIDRIIYLKKVTGSYSGDTPRATDRVWDEVNGIYQLVLAEIYVNPGVSEIIQANITDKRPDINVCGYITGTVMEMDFSQFAAQFNSYYANFVTLSDAEYNTWKINRNEDYDTWKTAKTIDYDAWIADFEASTQSWREGIESDQEDWENDFESDSEAWQLSFQTALMNWFSNMQGQISQDAAVNLQNQIDALKYVYVQDGILYIPSTMASVVNGILYIGTP